jgi:hypothetical protein
VLEELGNTLTDTPPKTVRFNITLDRKDAERMNQICREKRIPRDGFIRSYIAFLVNGVDEVCEAPLMKISKILANPQHEYEEKLRDSSSEDQVLIDQADPSFVYIDGVPHENPYSHLHFDDDMLNALERFMRNRTPETR